MKPGTVQIETLIDIMKLLRSQWLPQSEISAHLGLSAATTSRWVKLMASHGLLAERDGESGVGRTPKVYSAASAWVAWSAQGVN